MVVLNTIVASLQSIGWSIAVGESASGGLICAELSRLPGSSAWFNGGIVAYDGRSKTRALHVPLAILETYGSVSAETALAMAEGSRILFGATVGIGETSIAGPGGGGPSKPVGLSFVAVSSPRGDAVRRFVWSGEREQNRRSAMEAAIELLWEHLQVVAVDTGAKQS